jgi:hypothetical protein
MKSAKKVRVPRNKKITPKRKKMRSKPRKQSKKRKHRGGEVAIELNVNSCLNLKNKQSNLSILRPVLQRQLMKNCDEFSRGDCKEVEVFSHKYCLTNDKANKINILKNKNPSPLDKLSDGEKYEFQRTYLRT